MIGGGLLLADVNRADFYPASAGIAVADDRSLMFVPHDDADDEDEELEPGQPPKLKKLTDAQINRIRYLELRGMRLKTSMPDRVQVKIPRDVIDEFLIEMEGHPDFRGKKSRRAFLKKTPPQKLHVIAQYKGADYAEKVEIQSDPEVFVEYRRSVLPTVLRGCATSGCHAPTNEQAFGFRLFKDPKRTDATAYANYIILNDLSVGRQQMINRGEPEKSLLLTYLLPRKEVKVEFRHPGDVDYKPVFQSRKAPRFKRIQNWISVLKHPAEDYGVHLIPRPPLIPEEDEDDDGDAPATSRPSDGSKTQP